MKPGERSKILLGSTRSKGKMYEYNVPTSYHIKLPNNPSRLFPLSIGILGDVSVKIIESRLEIKLSDEEIESLLFSAHFLEAFYLSKLNPLHDDYIRSLVAAAYYLCSLPGSSLVYSKPLGVNFEDNIYHAFLNAVMKPTIDEDKLEECRKRLPLMSDILSLYFNYLEGDESANEIEGKLDDLRRHSYDFSNTVDLLLCDVGIAIIRLKVVNSVWTILPQSSNVTREEWKNVFEKESFIRELWPSQKILASEGVFGGTSATVQMPTSAGKTKSTEIILRSFFFKNTSQSAILVAPFKALCHEISDSLRDCFDGEEIKVNEFTDVFQKDYSDSVDKSYQVIVTTPEKLVYILRQDPNLSESIGLLILDEGHQFDSGIRGVTFELLITSLKQMLSPNTQWVLISAVLSNADSINTWLNGDNGKVVSGSSLNPTQKTIGFVDWSKTLGRIEYVKNPDINTWDFFVPRVIESTELEKKPRERKERHFPVKKDAGSIALYLGLKLVENGCVAIFCGTKSAVVNTCALLVNIHSRGYETSYPREISDSEELDKLANLYRSNLGDDSMEANAASLGVLTHHAALPHGLKLAVEYALREEKAKFVICTSTLAQGVNLPIRYLIFTNIYQAGEKLTVRDFHNLVGRAGRSGMHTEGTILFANPEVYEKRKSRKEGWRWKLIEDILQPENSEPCSSSLLSIFNKVHNSKKYKEQLSLSSETIEFLKPMITDPSYKKKIIKKIDEQLSNVGFDERTVSWQLNHKEKIIHSIEGYLLSNLPECSSETRDQFVKELTESTLAFYLASEEQRKWLYELFELISSSLLNKVSEPEKRTLYSKTLLGVDELKTIDLWIDENIHSIVEADESIEDILQVLWDIIYKLLPVGTIKKLSKRKAPFEIALKWIQGESYGDILKELNRINCKVKAGSQKRNPTIQNIVEVCDKDIAFYGMLTMGAIIELVSAREGMEDSTLPDTLRDLQKALKYGLLQKEKIRLFELGFSDRIVTGKIAKIFLREDRRVTKRNILELSDEIEVILKEFPSYFSFQLQTILKG